MKGIESHAGKKYLRTIRSAVDGSEVQVDLYAILVACGVTCPALAHCAKKILFAGQRGKGDRQQDLVEARDALDRAIELAEPPKPAKRGSGRSPRAAGRPGSR